MKDRYLAVTFRKGQVLAAYFHLPRRPGEKSRRTEKCGDGVLIDYGKDGRPIGIEITDPHQVLTLLNELNQVLAGQNVRPVEPIELSPLLAA